MEPSGSEQLCDDPDPGGKSQDQETKKQHESEQKLSKITHNALENINVIGQGLKHLFQHQRRRSSVSPHDVQQVQADLESDMDLESQSTCAEIDGVSTHPTALNRVLQQIRVPPKMKRGTSLHSRRGKTDPPIYKQKGMILRMCSSKYVTFLSPKMFWVKRISYAGSSIWSVLAGHQSGASLFALCL